MTEFGAFLLPVVPLLGLLAFLVLGRYPGCATIVRLSERFAGREAGRRSRPPRQRLPLPPRSFAPGGGLLIALGLAQRPPPALA